MTNHSGIYIPRDLIREECWDDDWSPEYQDTEAPTGGAVVWLLASVLATVVGVGWFVWHIIHR